jgi:DNA mismatch repair ATPase MutS
MGGSMGMTDTLKVAIKRRAELAEAMGPKYTVLLKVGIFYEAFGEHAERVSEVIGVPIVKRDGVKVCGFVCYCKDINVGIMERAGLKVACFDK